jgi:hypothetical protein
MRSHGVPNFPDPTVGGNGVQFLGSGSGNNPQSPAFQSAQTSCQRLLPGGGPGSGPPSAQAHDQLLQIAECMRRHGISSFPDPKVGSPSNLLPAVTRGRRSDPIAGMAFGARPGRTAKSRLLGLSIPALLIGLGFLAGAYFSYVDQTTGPEATARVSDCAGNYGRYSSGVVCQGTWVVGGALGGGNGHVVVGEVQDADHSDAGHAISVHLNGDTAYPTKNSLRVPIIFLVLGLPAIYVGARALVFGAPASWTGRRAPRQPAV